MRKIAQKLEIDEGYLVIQCVYFDSDDTISEEARKKLGEIQETVATLAEQSGGERQDNGSYKIPPEKIESLNNELAAFSDEEVEIEYTPITIKKDDILPPVLMDCLFDFIDME